MMVHIFVIRRTATAGGHYLCSDRSPDQLLSGLGGDDANRRAQGILERAAKRAGFQEVVFQYVNRSRRA